MDLTLDSVAVAVNTAWTMIAASLVFFMQAGFAMVEAGFTRSKNAANIVLKNLMDFAVASLVFWLVGFGLMFGESVGGLIGWGGLGSPELSFSHLGLALPFLAFLWFQTTFAGTTATIVSGAMAERTKFSA
ncbi:MAG: ammonium transporter, partial [Bacillota bacterium]